MVEYNNLASPPTLTDDFLNRDAGSGGGLLNTIMGLCWKINLFFSGVVVIAVGILYVKQDALLYFPTISGLARSPSQNPRRYRSPSEYNQPYETHLIPTQDGITLHSWLLHNSGGNNAESVPTILFFHGNAGNIGLRLPNAHQMLRYLNANIWLIEYRGYGDSDGKPSEAGLKLDAEGVWDYIIRNQNTEKLRHVDPRKVFVFGRSLGGAVAFHLTKYAEMRHYGHNIEHSVPPMPAGVIVENTFTSIADMVDHLMPIVAPLKSLVLRIGWDSSKIVPKLTCPTLFLAGAQDTLVPHEHMLRLHKLRKSTDSNNSLVRMHIVKDGTHNETWMQGGKEYWIAFSNFLKEALSHNASSGMASSHNYNPGMVQRKHAKGSGSLPEMNESSLSPTTSCEIEMGEDAAGMISSVGNFMGMAREALKGGGKGSNGKGGAPVSGGGGVYKKRD
jgi:pimeloyl-ACP methyl ester carboxylesterase